MGLVYRYRSDSALSFKELQYNEIMFSSLDELNDPLDGVIEYHFPKCKDTWASFCAFVCKENGEGDAKCFETAIDVLSRRTWERNELIAYLGNSLNADRLGITLQEIYQLKEAIEFWTYHSIITASFSKDYDHPVMWAHYARDHYGYCLEFETKGNKIPHSKRDGILPVFRNCYDGIGFIDVDYQKEYSTINGFLANPLFVDNHDENRAVSECILDAMNKKYKHWEYENETRMYVNRSGSFFRGNDYSEGRIYRYNILNLRGIIFGLRMNRSNKARVMEIVKRNRSKLLGLRREKSSVVPPIAFYSIKRDGNKYRFKRAIELALDWKNEEKYHVGFTALNDEYVEMKESGHYTEIDNDFDFGEWQLEQLQA